MDIVTHVLSGAMAGYLYRPEHTVPHGIDIARAVGSTGQDFTDPDKALPYTKRIMATHRAVRWTVLIGSVLPDINCMGLNAEKISLSKTCECMGNYSLWGIHPSASG